jgi:hypothetical protein
LVIALLKLLIVAWLPGAALFRLPWLERDRRAALDAEERLFWAVMLSLAVSLSTVLLLAAAHRYSFTRLLVVDLVVAAGASAAGRFRLRLGPAARGPRLTTIVPIALVAIGIWRFFPPSEYIIGGKDPGTYMNEGIVIAQRGTLVYDDPTVAAVPPFARDLFFPSHQHPSYYSNRFMGFPITDPERGAVVGQFPHLFPASIAIGYGIDGLTGARRTVGVWAILGLLALYFAGARLLGRTAAAAAALMLSLHVAQVWFARYPNAELPMQALLLAALLANARAHVDGDRFFSPVAALLLGLLLFLRFDAVLGIAGVLAGLSLGAFAGHRVRAVFFALLAGLGALNAAYLLGPMKPYAFRPIAFLSNLPWWQYVALAVVAAGCLAALLAGKRQRRLSAAVITWVPTVLVAGTIAAALYALFFRHPGGRLVAWDAYALRSFTNLYLTLPGLIGALLGYAIVTRRRFWNDPALILTVTISSFFFFYKLQIVPEHFWLARRFVPVILPGALLFIAAAAFARDRGGWPGARVIRPLIGLVFVGLLAAHYARVSRPLLSHVEYAGILPKLEQLAGTIQDDDLVVVESRDAGGDVHVLGPPLAYIYARNVLLLHSPRPDKPTFTAFLAWARTKYDRVLFLGGSGTDLLSHRYGVDALMSERFQVPEYESTRDDRLPRFARRKDIEFGLYQFTPPPSREGLWFDLDVGIRDDLHVLRFHAKEQSDNRTFRWTGATSYVAVTIIEPSSREVTMWLNNGGRPAAAGPADVEVSLHGQRLGTLRVGEGFRPYTLAVPAELAARAAALGDPVELRLATATWNPSKVLGTPDDRELGVMVDRVAVR